MAFFDDINDDEPKTGRSSNVENNSRENTKDNVKGMPPHQDSDLGEAPEFPAIHFTYDNDTNKLQVRDRRGNVKAEFTVMTVNGLSAYDLWKENHKNEPDTSYDAFIKDMKGIDGENGKNGKNAYEEWKEWRGTNTDRSEEAYWNYFKGENGKSAFELWKEVHGEIENSTPDDFFEYLKGQNGKDAFEVWQDLGYKNSTREDFFKWIAGLVETQKGEDGKIFYPHFDGFTLYFTEDKEGKGTRLSEQDVRGKDGRTFEPKFEGTRLHFEDGEGVKTNPVELKGKDAFELWKEYHHKPDAKYEEFEEYFKGQNVKADHSYLDIKDFTCPVQTIDTNLICSVLDSGASPDNLVKLRQEDIDKLRKEGNKRIETKFPYFFLNGSLIFENWAGFFKEFSWWCAGADRGLLRMCPGDHSKYTGIGTVILFTALMAWFSSFIAMLLVLGVRDEYLLTEDIKQTLAAAGFATFWGFMIFFLDRFITNTMYSDGKVSISKDEFFGGLPRILIAIFLGIVISAPLELRIFKTSIEQKMVTKLHDERIEFENNARTAEKAKSFLAINNLVSEIENDSINKSRLETSNNNLENDKKDPYPDSKDKAYYSNKYNAETRGYLFVLNKNQYDKAVKNWESRHTEYKNNKTKIKSLEDKISENRDRLKELKKSTDSVIDANVKQEYDLFVARQDTGLLRRLSSLHELAMEDYTPWFYKEKPDNYAPSKPEILTQILSDTTNIKENSLSQYVYGAENHKFAAMCDTIFHAWWWFLFNSAIGLIMLLFILIDISPVLYKMMLADGVYDNYLHQEKLLAQDKIRLSLARMLRNIEKGELKSLSPFIMGKIYRKLMKYSYSSDGKYKGEDKDYKNHIKWENAGGLNDDIKKVNKEVFDIVLDYKKRIVLASYSAWYRDMRDAMIGKKDDVEGSKITPESHLNNDDRAKNDEEQSNNTEKDNSSDDVDNHNQDDSTSNEDKHNED